MKTNTMQVGCCKHCSYTSDPKPTWEKGKEAVFRHHVRVHQDGKEFAFKVRPANKKELAAAKSVVRRKTTVVPKHDQNGRHPMSDELLRTKAHADVRLPVAMQAPTIEIPVSVFGRLDALPGGIKKVEHLALILQGRDPISGFPVMEVKEQLEEIGLNAMIDSMEKVLKRVQTPIRHGYKKTTQTAR